MPRSPTSPSASTSSTSSAAPEDTPAIADEAVKVGAKVLWLQTGIVSDEAAARAAKGGLTVVMDACIGATHAMLRIPTKD